MKLNIGYVAVWIRDKNHRVGGQMNKYRHLMPFQKPYNTRYDMIYLSYQI